jgi:hypothetical protein
VAGYNILPILFSLLGETEVADLSENTITFFISDSSGSKILDREVHALEFV